MTDTLVKSWNAVCHWPDGDKKTIAVAAPSPELAMGQVRARLLTQYKLGGWIYTLEEDIAGAFGVYGHKGVV